MSFWRPWGGPDFSRQGLKFGRVPSFLLDRRLSSMFEEKEEEMVRSSRL